MPSIFSLSTQAPKHSSTLFMELFRRLSQNIFFKIILAFVALTFVMFGISGFLLGNPNSWVAKVGGKTISYNKFLAILQNNRQAILATNNSPEALQYVDSTDFKSEVLGRMVNGMMMHNLSDDFGVRINRKVVLEAVAKNPDFRDSDGKFDHDLFKKFLLKNNLNQEKYVEIVTDELIANIVIKTFAEVAPISDRELIENAIFKNEKRVADVITVKLQDIKSITAPSAKEVEEFFVQNENAYSLPEMRTIAVLRFSKKNPEELSAIDDLILTSNSLVEVAKKFNLPKVATFTVNKNLQDKNSKIVSELSNIADFADNAFALQKGQASKIFHDQKSDEYYSIKVEEIVSAHKQELTEVKTKVIADLSEKTRAKKLQDLAFTIAKEVRENPENIAQIAAKYKVKFTKNQEFPRIYYVKFQSKQIPYKDKFLEELFSLKVGEATPAIALSHNEFNVGVLRQIKKSTFNKSDIGAIRKEAQQNFLNEMMQEFNEFLLDKHPVKINENLLKN